MSQASRPRNPLAGIRSKFVRNGFVVLPGFFDEAAIDAVQATIDRVKRDRPLDVVVDHLDSGERTVLGLLPAAAVQADRLKINDLFLHYRPLRDLALAPSLTPILQSLLGVTPVLCNSLYLAKGSAQAPHLDTLYMTPRTQGHLVASWVALEDAHPGAGPLEYFAGSHRIEPMRFGDGGYHVVETEMAAWHDYMDREVARLGCRKVSFLARKGDVFIWHANLLHGGGPIDDPALTRKSCVFHYYSETDARAGGETLVPLNGAFWMDRAAQMLPAEAASRLPFTERAYLARYPDVADAVRRGELANGRAHYEAFGREEGRLPA